MHYFIDVIVYKYLLFMCDILFGCIYVSVHHHLKLIQSAEKKKEKFGEFSIIKVLLLNFNK